MLDRAALLPEPQMEHIFQAIAKVGFYRHEFELEDRAIWARLVHKVSGSYFVIHRDATWRFVGHYAVGGGPERLFDLSWMSVIVLLGRWLAEVKSEGDAMALIR
jgi:hypothetical protein